MESQSTNVNFSYLDSLLNESQERTDFGEEENMSLLNCLSSKEGFKLVDSFQTNQEKQCLEKIRNHDDMTEIIKSRF